MFSIEKAETTHQPCLRATHTHLAMPTQGGEHMEVFLEDWGTAPPSLKTNQCK